MGETFRYAKQRDSTFVKTISKLTAAIAASDQEAISLLRRLIEVRYMAEIKSAQYDVILLIYDPIKRLRTGQIKETVVLATYEKSSHD
jgi:hypothetical protein